MTREELDRLWADPANWGVVYRCAQDPRVIVPRRRPWMGWTVNFAHPLAWFALLFSVAIAVGPAIAVLLLGAAAPLFVVVLIASVLVLIGASYWEASRSRE